MEDFPIKRARINSQLLSYNQSLETVKNNLFTCNSIAKRDYINKKGERQIFLEFHFPNGRTTLSIPPTDEVKDLLNSFLSNTGIFGNEQTTVAVRTELSK